MVRVRAAIVVCMVIFALDFPAGMLAMQAQAAENKGKGVTFIFIQWREPVHRAYQLGIAAVGLLVAAHAVATFLGGCACIFSRQESILASVNRKLAVLSWIAFSVAFPPLLVGAMSNAQSEASWGFIHFDFLALGGNICFVHGAITIAYFVTAIMANSEFLAHRMQGSPEGPTRYTWLFSCEVVY